MTCIVGFVEQGVVFLGGDSAGTGGHQQVLLSTPKVFRVGETILGCVGDFRMLQLLRYALTPPPYPDGGDVERYVVTDLTNAIRTCFRDGWYARKRRKKSMAGPFWWGYEDAYFASMTTMMSWRPATDIMRWAVAMTWHWV